MTPPYAVKALLSSFRLLNGEFESKTKTLSRGEERKLNNDSPPF